MRTLRKRDLVWRHNSFFGHVKMAEQNMRAIMSSETTTPAARTIAQDICEELRKLRECLKERVDNA